MYFFKNREQSSNVWLITLGVAKKPQEQAKKVQFDVGHPVVFKRDDGLTLLSSLRCSQDLRV